TFYSGPDEFWSEIATFFCGIVNTLGEMYVYGDSRLTLKSGFDIRLEPGPTVDGNHGKLDGLWALETVFLQTLDTSTDQQIDPTDNNQNAATIFRISTPRTVTLPPIFLDPGPPGNWNPKVNPSTGLQRSYRI